MPSVFPVAVAVGREEAKSAGRRVPGTATVFAAGAALDDTGCADTSPSGVAADVVAVAVRTAADEG